MVMDMNTTDKGQVRTIVFKEGDTWYGVAMEFNIVVDGDDKEVVHFNLQEAIKGYVESLRKIKGTRPESVSPALNQLADQEYETLWDSLQSKKPVPSPVEQVAYYGVAFI
jgi:predicted RNase H-like HicB family nuclease